MSDFYQIGQVEEALGYNKSLDVDWVKTAEWSSHTPGISGLHTSIVTVDGEGVVADSGVLFVKPDTLVTIRVGGLPISYVFTSGSEPAKTEWKFDNCFPVTSMPVSMIEATPIIRGEFPVPEKGVVILAAHLTSFGGNLIEMRWAVTLKASKT